MSFHPGYSIRAWAKIFDAQAKEGGSQEAVEKQTWAVYNALVRAGYLKAHAMRPGK